MIYKNKIKTKIYSQLNRLTQKLKNKKKCRGTTGSWLRTYRGTIFSSRGLTLLFLEVLIRKILTIFQHSFFLKFRLIFLEYLNYLFKKK